MKSINSNYQKNLFFYAFILLFILNSAVSLLAQDIRLPSKNSGMENTDLNSGVKYNNRKDNSVFMKTPEINFSEKEKQITREIERLKKPGNVNPEGGRIVQLQKEIEKTNGSTVTKTGPNDFCTIVPADKNDNQQTDNLDLNYLIYGDGNYVASIAAQVEQIGPTAGKIWVAVGQYNGDTGYFATPDTIKIFYSDNNGISYNLFRRIEFSDNNKIDFDNMDMEIIEDATGTKYMHLVFGYTKNGGYGQSLIGYTVLSIPAGPYSGQVLYPPGYDANSKYTKVRIASDNARYPANAYVTIVITQDSISGPDHYFMSKICKVQNPYTPSPAVTYLSQCFYGITSGFNSDVFTDVAHFHNGIDSVIYVLSSYPNNESKIYFYKGLGNLVTYPSAAGFLLPTGDDIEYARVASNGGTDQKQLVITLSDNYLNSGDFDQYVAGSTDGGTSWGYVPLDFSQENKSRYGDIIGRRNTSGSFSIAFKNIYGNMENVSAYTFSNTFMKNRIPALNTDYANTYASPKPIFRYLNNDSCLNIWSYYNAVTSTGGCEVSNLYVRVALEGYYDLNTDEQSVYAPVKILLAESTPPYNVVDTGFAYLDVQGMSNVFTFPRGLSGNFYLIVKHFNCIETWSAAPVNISSNPVTVPIYDFTTSNSMSYGNNMVQKGTRWCLYSGDVDQNGTIDLTDVVSINNDASEFVSVLYAVTDLNGDSFTDLTDLLLGFNNSGLFITKITPP